MDIGIILSVVSLIFPLIATIINAKGPKKYKNIYVNFLFFTVGLSLGIIIICASLKVSNIINSEKVSISINKCENDLSTKVSNLNYGDYKSILPVMYSCTITNLGEKPVTCVNYDILSNIDVKNRPYSPGMGFLDGETKIVKPFTLLPFESKTFNIVVAEPLDENIYKLISDHYDVSKYINFYDLMIYLSTYNTDIYGSKIEYVKLYRYLIMTLNKNPSFFVMLKTAGGNCSGSQYLTAFSSH